MKKLSHVLQLFFCCLIFHPAAQAQASKIVPNHGELPIGTAKKTPAFILQSVGTFKPQPYDSDFQPVLFTPARFPNEHGESDRPDSLTKAKTEIKRALVAQGYGQNFESPSGTGGSELSPVVCHSFQGNGLNGCPPDNTLAVSRQGYIVSAVNQNLFFFDENGTLLNAVSLFDFFDAPNVSDFLCDPKVIYDPAADRFIFFSQTCDGQSSSSKILLAFSSSENPNAPWSVYVLSGNPLNDGSWFDYPKVAVSENELYVTGNLFADNHGPFKQSVLYQIQKWPGYTGDNLSYQVWYDIPGFPFTLLPVSYGQDGTYGPGCYLVSTFAEFGANISFYDLTGDLGNPNTALDYYLVLTDYFQKPLPSFQAAGSDLDSGDSRMMDGFYLPPYLHCAFTVDDGNGWAGIRYYRINVGNFSASNYFASSNVGNKDYCYPAISSFSNNPNDHSTLLTFVANGPSSFPEVRVKSFDNDWNTSASISVKSGQGLMSDICYNTIKEAIRWGDYSGSCRKLCGSKPAVWLSGCYSGNDGVWRTWVAEIKDGDCSPCTSPTYSPPNLGTFALSPNPAQALVNVQIQSTQTYKADFLLYDQGGQLVGDLYEATVFEGENTFAFNTVHLPNGAYLLQVFDREKRGVYTQKIIVQH